MPNVLDSDMRIQCAWCGFVVREGDASKTTHGMCERCQSMTDEEIDLQVEYMRARTAQEAPTCDIA